MPEPECYSKPTIMGGVTVSNMIIVNGIKESNPRKYFQKAYDNFVQLQSQIVPCLTLKKT